MKIAIIGCGQIADIHIGEIHQISDVKLVAVCDANKLMAEQAAVRFGVPKFYSDVERMFTQEYPDIVHITTPPQSHLALGKLAVAHGAHVYMEKPFTATAAEAKELVAAAESAGRQICVGHNYSFDGAALEAKRLAVSGALGELVHIDSVYGYNLDGSFGKLLLEKPKHWTHSLPGKLFQNVISHALYNITDYITDDFPEIHAWGSTLRSQRFGDVRDRFHDELRVLIRGQRCTGQILFSSHARPIQHCLRLYGTKATVHADFQARTVSFERASSLPGALGRVALPFHQATDQFRHGWRNAIRFAKSDLQYNDGMRRLFATFYDAIRHNKLSPIPMREAIRVTRIMDEIFHQAQP